MELSDFDEDEYDSLYQKNINKSVKETVIRTAVPVQRDLFNNILPGQQSFYEEIQRDVTFGRTHHDFNDSTLNDYIYPTNFEVRDYQFDIVKRALFTNLLCAIPTGMGKTFIASTVMLNFFRWTKTGKVIFMAPTRPLVAQQIKACLGVSGIPSNQTAILLDKTRRNREDIWQEKRVFFTTPQVVENDLKRGVLNPKDIVCLVVDEAHRATGSYAYTNVVQFINRFNTSYRILALTATPGSTLENVQEVVNNLTISTIEIRTEESEDIVKYMKHKEREEVRIELIPEIEDIIEQLGIAITPVLKQAVELGIYEECEPTRINAFVAMQQSQKIISNPNIPEGIKWRNFFILQLLNHFGQMLKRIKIYGIRTFYNYFKNKYNEFTTKYNMGKSTNKIAASFYFHPILKVMMKTCDGMTANSQFLGHGKLERVREELEVFFIGSDPTSRIIIFTELRESALEIVRCVDSMRNSDIRPHIFIGQSRGKEGFDEVEFTRKHKAKGRKKVDRLSRQAEQEMLETKKKQEKEKAKLERSARRTASSEEAQINGMNQKQQKDVIRRFKAGEFNVLVCTSIGEEGLDIGEVDCIICYDTTSSPIKNIQRMGRTGRKRDGRIVLLFSSNESFKFQQAMEDYISLQKMISQDYIEYKESDRILPKDITPHCVKKFMTINESDETVNNMEDTDDVILYATQCMLGKKVKPTKAKKVTKRATKAKPKQFFMPDNVPTGIISAGNLVNKYVENGSGELSLVKKEHSNETKAPTMLDKIGDSSSSSGMSDNDEDEFVQRKKAKTTIKPLSKQKSPVFHNVHLNPVKSEPTAVPNLSEIENSSLKTRVEVLGNQGLSNTKRISTDQENSPSYTKSGFLTPDEHKYFKEHYEPNSALSMDLIPNFENHTKISKIRHSTPNTAIIKLFSDLRSNNVARTIDMNRTNCIAKALHTSNQSISTSMSSDLSLRSHTASMSQSTQTREDVPDLSNEKVLDDILGSDSDF
ncbi:similar to Saccharomyces cerevisiae YIR002C MPH1 Member of the DEAH family of helicases [Maudiozyma barnettii]|uniref:ATP-dependent DNA helicase n=1 Tax=Maudiozyma barnettii TaxID=61262 RepID=A0A8H2VJ76_9SACH|nr:3'-5' DNA helicase [Kazachstania barnettii]CAB4256381.1 similar to Saccharomyces cerevisiae YIR002C MPH1 Member of the DEAH family of helicases [Kazachstania barnettii]CAD1784990.1 similar to Saccharomyces cerevisiae YIR002C MPH1 Member of the DEAH family of helicases [Kazachstania barnettii]